MATRSWVGGTSGNWNTAANWSPATVPIAADDVIINSGSVSIDDGLDQSTVNLATMVIGPDYTGEVGNSTTAPLKIGCDLLTIDGGGTNHYVEGGSGANVIDVLRVMSVGSTGLGTVYVVGGAGGALGRLIVAKGTAQLVSGTFTDVILQAEGATTANAALDVLDATITTLYQGVGSASILSTSTSGVITTAYVTTDTLQVLAGTLTNLYLWGGTVTWSTTTNMSLAMLFGGALDASGDPTARTITNLHLYTGATANLDNGVQNITVTNTFEYGGTKKPAG